MSLDACFLSFLTRQLNSELCGMRTEKIFMPSKDESVFVLRGGQHGGKRRLLINASTNAPRVSLTDAETENPAVPPTFCMVLRKHFTGARLDRVYMPQFERCAVFEFECKNDFFEPVVKSIVVELMGRSANMIIIEGDVQNGRIIDAVRRADLSGGRTVLPSARFESAPAQQGKIPFSQLRSAHALLSNPELTLEQAIMQNVSGISPLNAREIAYLSTGSVNGAAASCLWGIYPALKSLLPGYKGISTAAAVSRQLSEERTTVRWWISLLCPFGSTATIV